MNNVLVPCVRPMGVAVPARSPLVHKVAQPVRIAPLAKNPVSAAPLASMPRRRARWRLSEAGGFWRRLGLLLKISGRAA